MAWTSRFGNLGRFSPFTRSPQNSVSGSSKVSDSDFSYITADDLRKYEAASVSAVTDGPQSESPADYGPPRDEDVLILRNKRQDYVVQCPAYSIAKGELKIRDVREAAAKKLMAGDSSRIKLLYKGKNLKDDNRTALQEGLKDGCELLVSVVEAALASRDDTGSEDDDDDDEGEVVNGEVVKKRRNRGKKSKRKNRREQQTSGQSSPRPPPTPATPLDKLNALHQTLASFQTEVDAFIANPPAEAAKRDYEHKRLSETIFTQVQLKLDAVETEGDEDARTRRKELVKETQRVLGMLDAAVSKP